MNINFNTAIQLEMPDGDFVPIDIMEELRQRVQWAVGNLLFYVVAPESAKYEDHQVTVRCYQETCDPADWDYMKASAVICGIRPMPDREGQYRYWVVTGQWNHDGTSPIPVMRSTIHGGYEWDC